MRGMDEGHNSTRKSQVQQRTVDDRKRENSKEEQ